MASCAHTKNIIIWLTTKCSDQKIKLMQVISTPVVAFTQSKEINICFKGCTLCGASQSTRAPVHKLPLPHKTVPSKEISTDSQRYKTTQGPH